jgi:hypothetical protein
LLYANGVYTLCFEFARQEDQKLIDSLLNSPRYDENLAQLIQFNHYVHWPFREYRDVYKTAWQLNQTIPEGGRKFRVVAFTGTADWSLVKQPEDRDNPEIMARVWRGVFEPQWGQLIIDSVLAKGEKALVYSGIHHAFTEYRQLVVVNGKCIRLDNSRTGNIVYAAIGKQAITIALNAPLVWQQRLRGTVCVSGAWHS